MILITRPGKEAQELAATLNERGYKTFIEPMLILQTLAVNVLPLPEVQAYVTTSKNARPSAPAGKTVVAIPEQGKNVEALLGWITENLKPDDGRLVYLRGEHVSFDLTAALQNLGFRVEEVITYRAREPQAFTPEFVKRFSELDIALFFSKRSLHNFLRLAAQNSLNLNKLRALCLSPEILCAAKAANFKQACNSKEPNLNSLLARLDEIY